VLKIEGRGRSADYVKTVTQCYREAADAVLENNFTTEKAEEWMNRLSKVYNRGFWDGYYLGRKTGEWTEGYGSSATHKKVYIGKVTNFFTRVGAAEIKIETGDLTVGDEYVIMGPTTGVCEGIATEIRLNLIPAPVAQKGSVCSMIVPIPVRRNDKLYKVVPVND
jgi:putative protease